MSEEPTTLDRVSYEAVSGVSEVLELLEVLWERGRATVTAAPVSTTQIRVMYLIERHEGINMRDLGTCLGAAAPSVTRVCDRLRALGFVEKTQHTEDRREVRLRLTDAGAAHLEDLRARRKYALAEAMAGMTPAGRAALAEGLTDFVEAVGQPVRLPQAQAAGPRAEDPAPRGPLPRPDERPPDVSDRHPRRREGAGRV